MRRYGGGWLERPHGQEASGHGPAGGHLSLGGVPAIGDGCAFGHGDPLGIPEAGVYRARAVLCVSRDRILCGGGIRFHIKVVQEGVPAATPAGLAAAGGESEEVRWGRGSLWARSTGFGWVREGPEVESAERRLLRFVTGSRRTPVLDAPG